MRNFFYRLVKNITGIYICCLCVLTYELMISEIPDKIYVEEGSQAELNVEFPFVIQSRESDIPGQEKKLCSFLGIIPIKEVTVSVAKGQDVYLGGEIVGIYTRCDGVFVIDTAEIELENGQLINSAGDVVQTGDYIIAIDGEKIDNKEEMVDSVLNSDGQALQLTISRNGDVIDKTLTPVLAKNGEYMLGIWVKDDLAGVGTITYVTSEGDFAALGHGMGDGETQELLQIEEGDIYISEIIGIDKGTKGNPGQVKGVIYYGDTNHLGEVDANISTGVFGKLDEKNLEEYVEIGQIYEVAHKQDIEVGEAQIISEISGEQETYDIRITYVDYLAINSNKGLHIEVTDPRLLELTGGIVQGMSGSPIIQNGKIVGAVTHVLINDPTSGYGIFLEDMLEY